MRSISLALLGLVVLPVVARVQGVHLPPRGLPEVQAGAVAIRVTVANATHALKFGAAIALQDGELSITPSGGGVADTHPIGNRMIGEFVDFLSLRYPGAAGDLDCAADQFRRVRRVGRRGNEGLLWNSRLLSQRNRVGHLNAGGRQSDATGGRNSHLR